MARRPRNLRRHGKAALLIATVLMLGVGAMAYLAGAELAAHALWISTTALGLIHSTSSITTAIRQRQPSVDVIAWLALVGALIVGEFFAGAVIAVMLATGGWLEERAANRARRDLSLLIERAPRTARLRAPDGVVEIPAEQVAAGDRLIVGTGEIMPVDGRLLDPAVLDESALTGEPLPIERRAGDTVRSGVVNAGSPVNVIATAEAAVSTYAAVVRLVEQTQAASAPFVRIADRTAVAFVPLALTLAGAAWVASGDAVRAVAVLVVATPCPLLLAVPIAIMSGLSRAARVGVVLKGGSALEQLAAGRIVLFDKTGTLTHGRPELSAIVPANSETEASELLRLAASLEQVSAHTLASAIVAAARERGLPLDTPSDVHEHHGYGVDGLVGGRRVRLGKAAWIVPGLAPTWVRRTRRRAALDGSLAVFASVDGVPAGAFLFEDVLRADAPRMVRALRTAGISRVVLVTGDRADAADAVGRVVGVDTVYADRDPADKLTIINAERAAGPTIMVGDGINDAPALAAAGVGVALAARGATASAQAADVVMTVDRIDALADAILIARRARRIAMQAVVVGMGLALAAMVAAAAGYIPPAAGALLQEGIDVAAIAIALRALLPAGAHTVSMSPSEIATAQRLYQQHRSVRPLVEEVRTIADALTTADGDLLPVHALLDQLDAELLPHERAEEAELLPIVARALGGADPTAALSRTHAEIEHQVLHLRRLLEDLPETAEPEDVVEIRRVLYGLYAILRLHNAQEEEAAFSLVPDHGNQAAGRHPVTTTRPP